MMPSESSVACGDADQVMRARPSAWRASHQVSAITATAAGSPCSLPSSARMRCTGPPTTVRSKLVGTLPKAGGIATAAYFIPGSRTSMPY